MLFITCINIVTVIGKVFIIKQIRDIKPENFLFSKNGDDSTLKMIDFGLTSFISEDLKYMKSKVGTCLYMAPEVLRGEYSKECDLWSAGVILFVILAGYHPFFDEEEEGILTKIIEL
jgi:calcium-dependent protein kinase